MTDNDITEIVGWPDKYQMQRFRDVAKKAVEQERESLAQFFEAHWRDAWKDEELVEAIRTRTTT
jgi:hypothetical protein